MTLAELEEKQKQLRKELAEVDADIAAVPESVKGILTEAPDDLIDQIEWMRRGEENISIRNSNSIPCDTISWKFKSHHQIYTYYKGDGDYQTICEVEGAKRDEIDFNWLYETWEAFMKEHDQGSVTDALTTAEIMKQPRHIAVGYLLRRAEGW